MKVIATAAGLLTALTLAAGTSASTKPTLRVAALHPFTAQGRAFAARERVTVTLTAKGRRSVRRATATATGAFTVRFDGVAVDRCNGYSVRAIGTAGSTAFLKSPPLPACMPASTQ